MLQFPLFVPTRALARVRGAFSTRGSTRSTRPYFRSTVFLADEVGVNGRQTNAREAESWPPMWRRKGKYTLTLSQREGRVGGGGYRTGIWPGLSNDTHLP